MSNNAINNQKNNKLVTRFVMYILGIFIVAVGVVFAMKSQFGISPSSSIPNTIEFITGGDVPTGYATMMFHTSLVVIQLILLRSKFKWTSIFQVPVGVMFGTFINFANGVAVHLGTPDGIVARIFMLLASVLLIAIGLFFFVPANIMPLAVEGLMGVVADMTGKKFSDIKTFGDILFVIISFALCMIFLGSMGSVGIGTVVSAVGVGQTLGLLNKWFGKYRDKLIK